MDLFRAYRDCNHTELYQLCRARGLKIPPNATREELMVLHFYGTNDFNPASLHNEFDSWRHGLAGFVLDHWTRLQNQVTCPLRSKDPLSCFGCLDTQVVTCIIGNPSNELNIERYKK